MEKFFMHASVAFIVLVGIVTVISSAITCPSRFYCHTEEIKYMSMSKKENIYLNVTIISKYNTENITECQRLCNRHPRCFSININMTVGKNLECQLLGENIFSNASKIVSDTNFMHLFMESPCSRYPCQNNGTCVPQYNNDSYTCKCVNTLMFKSFGKDCEKTLTNFEAANFYWTFDSFPNKAKTKPDFEVLSQTQAFYEPGRRTPVAYCYDKMNCARITQKIACVTSFKYCDQGFTYSFWFKLRHVDNACDILFNIDAGEFTGNSLTYHERGLIFKAFPTKDDKWITAAFGRSVNMGKWTHIVLSFQPSFGVCAYLNGKLELCQNAKQSANVIMDRKQLRFGYKWENSTRCELFVDDFAVWKAALAKEDILKLYEDSRD